MGGATRQWQRRQRPWRTMPQFGRCVSLCFVIVCVLSVDMFQNLTESARTVTTVAHMHESQCAVDLQLLTSLSASLFVVC